MSLIDSILSQVTSHVDVENLAAKVGLDPATAEKAIAALSAAHPQAAGILGMLDKDGDGNPLDDIAGMAKGLFGN